MSSLILSKICENLLLEDCLLSNNRHFSIGVPALNSADICLVNIDRLLFEILTEALLCILFSIVSGLRPLFFNISLASSKSDAFTNPFRFFSFTSNALYL